jgi:pyrroline-5-carboxylate reductase
MREPELKIGFIGAGQMGRALARGFVQAGLCQPTDLLAYDPITAAVEQFESELPGAGHCGSNAEVVTTADVVFLAVKPQCLPEVMAELRTGAPGSCLFVSIIAGTPLATLCDGLRSQRVVRVMPNTPCLIGCGATGYAVGPSASDEDARLVARLLASVGTAVPVEENQLDAVTGLSGSGPAYVYTMIEALSDGGVRMGLPRATATALAAQTVYGAAKMVLETTEHPGVLRDRVTSPGGTTIAGLQVLEQNGLRSALIDAVEAATLRSQELGSQELGSQELGSNR